MCIVLARVAREGPNTQGQAGCFMSVTGHHLEDVMVNCHPPWHFWKGDWQDHSTPRGSFSTPLEAGEESHRRDLSSMFMTVGDTVTFWHLQFFSTVTFEFEEDPVTHFVVLPNLQKEMFHPLSSTLYFVHPGTGRT